MNPFLRLAAYAARILPGWIKRTIYRFKPLARILRNAMNRAAPHELSLVRVAAGGLAGFSLELNLQTEKDYWLGTYEIELQRAVAELVQPGTVIYDVGANIGYITLLLARRTGKGGQVFSFEALPANVARLQKNVNLNHLENRVEIVSAAVVDRAAPVRFLVHPSTSMGKAAGSAGREKAQAYLHEIEVTGVTLDGFVFDQGRPTPQVVKMDIEGGEVLAIQGMQRLLSTSRPLLLIELHGHEAARVVCDALQNHAYSLHHMQSGYPEVMSVDELDWKAYVIGKP
jgi:FkbM family methyltransferase